MKKTICLFLAVWLVLSAAVCALAAEDAPLAEPPAAEPSVGTEYPAETEAPAETEEPFMTEPPIETEPPAETETPVETEPPAETETPVETEAPAETEEPAAPEEPDTPETVADREIPLWVDDPDWAIMNMRIGNERPFGLVIYDGQTVPAGATVDFDVRPGHTLTVTGGTVAYTGGSGSLEGYLAAVIHVYDDAEHLHVQVKDDISNRRPAIKYEGEDGLVIYKDKVRNVPEDGVFPIHVKRGASLRLSSGTLVYYGQSDTVPGYVVYLAEVDPNGGNVTVQASVGGSAVLRVQDPTGKAVVRAGQDVQSPGSVLDDGDTLSGLQEAMVWCPEGYMTMASLECTTLGQVRDGTGWVDMLSLLDFDGDGQAVLTLVPAAEVVIDLPEGYPASDPPAIAYGPDGDRVTAGYHTVPTGSAVVVGIHQDYRLTAENASVRSSWYEGGQHMYLLSAPNSGDMKLTVAKGPANPFKDVDPGSWYYDNVMDAYSTGVVTGQTEDTFGPNYTATRGQTVAMLHRMAGSPAPSGAAPFTDLKADYYKNAVAWAAEQKIVTGTTATTFEPEANVTRQQLAVMLHRMAGTPAAAGSLDGFTDSGDVQDYALEAVKWALGRGILTGDSEGSLRPGGYATRAEVCAMLMRYRASGPVWTPNQTDWVASLKAAANNKQLLIVAAQGSTAAVSLHTKGQYGVWAQDLSVSGYVGSAGIGKASEGDNKTPKGQYGFTMAFGAQPDPGCAIAYTKLDDTHYWVDDGQSKYYNQFVSTRTVDPDWSSAEHLLGVGAAYDYALALNYNSANTPGLGSAIFLHCSTGTPTAGCIAIPTDSMKQVLEKVEPGCVVIIDTPEGVKSY